MQWMAVTGARTHNLKNISLTIPRDQLVVITGVSGSGKSSLAFDTLYAEGQRRYIESLSAYARQFLSLMEKPDVDQITGLSPAISIEQKSVSHNPRSTVGTITEIYDYLRLLFARVGQAYCPVHRFPLTVQTISEMVDETLELPHDLVYALLAPVPVTRDEQYAELLVKLKRQGYLRYYAQGAVHALADAPAHWPEAVPNIDIVIDRFKLSADTQSRLAASFEVALALSDGIACVQSIDAAEPKLAKRYSRSMKCPECQTACPALTPTFFSFNSPTGACRRCDGLGREIFFDPDKIIPIPTLSLASGAISGWNRQHRYHYDTLKRLSTAFGFSLEVPYATLPEAVKTLLLYGTSEAADDEAAFEGVIPRLERRYRESNKPIIQLSLNKLRSERCCTACQGKRLNEIACGVRFGGQTLPELSERSIEDLLHFFQTTHYEGTFAPVALKLITEVSRRLHFLVEVGLNYLTLSRHAETLSGGEAQRIRLASQIGAGLLGVMYVLDEPSIGLHPRDNHRLINSLKNLQRLGNSVIVVEHDEETILAADYIIDMGPGAGTAGGEVIAAGTPTELLSNPASLTAPYLIGKAFVGDEWYRPALQTKWAHFLWLRGARANNLNSVTLQIPLGALTCVAGVSGSGKSTLINETLYPVAQHQLNRSALHRQSDYDAIEGLEYLDKVIAIDQAPIGRTPRSNPATYTGLFTEIRALFAALPESKARGYADGRFSFNVQGGRCEACQGDGLIRVEMHFLPDVYVPCERCEGQRYNRETLEIQYKGKNIAEVLQLSIEEARFFFSAVPAATKKLETLASVGLGYLQLGQPATTLSGGEAQRLKLSKELSKRPTGRTLYLLDEPTTGLHFKDIDLLLRALHTLKNQGNTVLVIEHNLDVIKTADWLVELGPEGGSGGGRIVANGPLCRLLRAPTTSTLRYLRQHLEKHPSPLWGPLLTDRSTPS